MSIIITGPMQFGPIESVGRRIVLQFGQMDRMSCIFTGPDSTRNDFAINSPHPDYPLMFVTQSDFKTIPGGLVEASAVFDGKITTSGASSYVTDGVTEESAVQGSRDFQKYLAIAYINGLAVSSAPPGTTPIYNVVAQSFTVRYIGTQCRVRYQAYPRPTATHYSSLGLSRVSFSVLSTTPGSSSVVVSGTFTPAQSIAGLPPAGVQPLFAANLGFDIVQRGKWYDCIETYGPTF